MSYRRAIQLANRYDNEHEQELEALRQNALLNKLNFSPKAGMGILGLSLGSRVGTMGSIGAAEGSLMDTLGPLAGYGLMASLPLRAMSQFKTDSKRQTDLKKQRALLEQSPGSITTGDIIKAGSLNSQGVSKGAMSTFMGMSAAGALTGSQALQDAAMAPYMVSGLTGGPLRALSSLGGMGAMAGYGMGSGAKAAALANVSNPMMAGMAMLPGMLGSAVGGGVSGLGSLAGAAGFGSVGSAATTAAAAIPASGIAGSLAAGGAGIAKGAGAITAMGLANPVVGLLTGALTMALAQPVVTKAMDKIKEGAGGQTLLKSGSSLRPRVESSGEIQRRYSLTSFLDGQTNRLIMSGTIDAGTGVILGYLNAIEKHVSGVDYMVEWFQTQNADRTVSSNLAQNSLQTQFGHSGDQMGDLSQKYNGPDDGIDTSTWSGRAQAATTNVFKKVVNAGEILSIVGSFFNPIDYMKGGTDSPFAKLRSHNEENQFQDTINKVSNLTGIPTSFLVAMETSATSLANMGETSQDKTVMLLGGIHELQRFSAFRLQDIANAMGIQEEDSLMGAIDAVRNEGDTRSNINGTRGFFGEAREQIAGSGMASIAGTVGGLALGGPLGALLGLGLTGIAPNILESLRDRSRRKRGEIKNFSDVLDDNEDGEVLSSVPEVGRGIMGGVINNTYNNDNSSIDNTSIDNTSIDNSSSNVNGSKNSLAIWKKFNPRLKTITKLLREIRDCVCEDCCDETKTKITGGSADATQAELFNQSRADELRLNRLQAYDSVNEMYELSRKEDKGLYVRFNNSSNKIINSNNADMNKQLELLQEIEDNTDFLEEIAMVGVGGGLMGFFAKMLPSLLKGGLLMGGLYSLFSGASDDVLSKVMSKPAAQRLSGMVDGAMIGSVFGLKGAAIGALAGWVMESTSQLVDSFLEPKEFPQANKIVKNGLHVVEAAIAGFAIGGPWGAFAGALGAIAYKLGPKLWDEFTADERTPEEQRKADKISAMRTSARIEEFEEQHPEEFTRAFGTTFGEGKGEYDFNEKDELIYRASDGSTYNTTTLSSTLSRSKLNNNMMQEEYVEKFKENHSDNFHFYGDSGEFKTLDNKLLFTDYQGLTWDVKKDELLGGQKAQKNPISKIIPLNSNLTTPKQTPTAVIKQNDLSGVMEFSKKVEYEINMERNEKKKTESAPIKENIKLKVVEPKEQEQPQATIDPLLTEYLKMLVGDNQEGISITSNIQGSMAQTLNSLVQLTEQNAQISAGLLAQMTVVAQNSYKPIDRGGNV